MKLIPILLIVSVSFLSILPAQALKSDRDQPADIEADDIEFDFPNGTKTYKKNVLIVQGTLRIKADELVTQDDLNGDLSKATATGSPARFKQRPDDKPDDVEGWAQRIVVDQQKNLLTLYGDASLKQGTQTAQGETIEYNMETDVLKVLGNGQLNQSGADGTDNSDKKIEDPFKDDPLPVVAPTQTATTSTEQTTTPNTTPNTQNSAEKGSSTDTQTVTPAPSGRSRLIINPKN